MNRNHARRWYQSLLYQLPLTVIGIPAVLIAAVSWLLAGYGKSRLEERESMPLRCHPTTLPPTTRTVAE